MQECKEVTPSSFRKRRKKRSFRFSTMKALKKAREYKSKKKVTEEGCSVQKILEYPVIAQKQQDIGKASDGEDGNETPQVISMVLGSDDDEEAFQEVEEDSPCAEETLVWKSLKFQSV